MAETAVECLGSQRLGLVDYADTDSDSEHDSDSDVIRVKEQVVGNCHIDNTKYLQDNYCRSCQDNKVPHNEKDSVFKSHNLDRISKLSGKECICQNKKDFSGLISSINSLKTSPTHPANSHDVKTISISAYGAKPDCKKRKLNDDKNSEDKFAVPACIKSMFQERSYNWIDNPAEHDGRIRSFSHVEGDWATHVYIEVMWTEQLFELVKCLTGVLNHLPFNSMQEFHMSLSRTVPIRHHWIDPLVETLRENFKTMKTTICDLSDVKLFTNDEKTRTFICLELIEEDTVHLNNYISAVNNSFEEFKLPKYYENPSFHMSLAWCLGDVTKDVSESDMTKLKAMIKQFIDAYPDQRFVYVSEILCRTGNKKFVIPLVEKVDS